MQDHAVNSLRARDDRQPSHVAVPVLARAIAIRGHAAVRKVHLAMARLEHYFGRHRDGGGDFGALEDARPPLAHLGQETRFPPPATSLLVLCPREVQAPPRSRTRDAKQPPLLGPYTP